MQQLEVTPAVEVVVVDLARELTQLMTIGESWQIVLHGGSGGEVLTEVKRTRKLVRRQWSLNHSVGRSATIDMERGVQRGARLPFDL